MTVLNGWCGRVLCPSLATVTLVLVLDGSWAPLPLHGPALLLYTASLLVLTVWLTFVCVQKLLQVSVPLEYGPRCSAVAAKLSSLVAGGQSVSAEPAKLPRSDPIDRRIEALVDDIEDRFVSKWYRNISSEGTFPAEAKMLLEGVVRRVLQVTVQVDSSRLLCNCLAVLLKHLKEYRRAVRRAAKNGCDVDATYRYAHAASKSPQALEHFVHRLTANVVREFISWELWNSLPCKLLVAVLAKRFTHALLQHVAQPGWLNHVALSVCLSKELAAHLQLDRYAYVSLRGAQPEPAAVEPEPVPMTAAAPPADSCTPKKSPRRRPARTPDPPRADEVDAAPQPAAPAPVAPAPVRARKATRPARSEPVVIHAARSAERRWDSDCGVSLGQDMLALDALDAGAGLHGFSGRRLWGRGPAAPPVDAPPWDAADGSARDADEATHTPRLRPPTATTVTAAATTAVSFVSIAGNVTHNMKELQQSTVNNVVRPVSSATEKAMHRIGDLQDEAVGVVEGIFDFGMAGIRKGLRLTGLQDAAAAKPGRAAPAAVRPGTKPTDSLESVWINPLGKDSPNGYENQMLLERSPAGEGVQEAAADAADVPDVCEEQLVGDSPEYEETADLASTISKLRSLLQQKSSESSLNTPALSPMPLDDVVRQCALTPLEATVPDGAKAVDRGMQRIARTVTGMFNTFKTALPGGAADQRARHDHWIYVDSGPADGDLPALLDSLLVERRDYCTVDTAYEAMDSIDLMTDSANSHCAAAKFHWDVAPYEDEPDDLEACVPLAKALADMVCECLQDTDSAITREPVLRALLATAGPALEQALAQRADTALRLVNRAVGPLPRRPTDLPTAMGLEQFVGLIEGSLPAPARTLFGRDLSTALTFLFSSLQSHRINQDVALQLFELVATQLIYASTQLSPTPSA